MTVTIDPIIEDFEQIIEDEDFEIACECGWHGNPAKSHGDEPAKWIVRQKPRPCGCNSNPVSFWCDPCLQAVLAAPLGWFHCARGGHPFQMVPRHSIQSYEPIHEAP